MRHVNQSRIERRWSRGRCGAGGDPHLQLTEDLVVGPLQLQRFGKGVTQGGQFGGDLEDLEVDPVAALQQNERGYFTVSGRVVGEMQKKAARRRQILFGRVINSVGRGRQTQTHRTFRTCFNPLIDGFLKVRTSSLRRLHQNASEVGSLSGKVDRI
jgi:hypothetical protein